ncbi:MAG: ADYC domain-containing protein [Myxococcota bacterium]
MRTLPFCWTLALLAGCGLDPGTPVAARPMALKGEGTCDDFLCTGNSPHVQDYAFSELNSQGLAAPSGLKLLGATKNGLALKFTVEGTMPVASSATTSLRGPALVGVTLRLGLPGGATKDVRITDFTTTTFYDGSGRLPAFRLQYLDPVDTAVLRDVCQYATVDDHGLNGTWVLFSRGERYDAATASITAVGAAAGDWFNVSCAGDPIAKLVRLGHVEAAESASHHTTVAARQAALNMFTANYCGDGVLYTVAGTQLRWQDAAGVTPPQVFGAFEAVWTEHGAACLTNPRYVSKAAVHCQLPDCTALQETKWPLFGDLASALPPP